MHGNHESDVEGEYLPPDGSSKVKKSGRGTIGGVLVGLGLLAAKFKTLLLVLLNFKWLLLAPKLFLSFGSLFISIWFYALFFGWKFGVVFVLLILVHELGHYVTFRNFGINASLPFFIPGFGAFVAARGPAPSLTVEAIATLAGPVFGIAAAGLCYAYALATHEPFWLAAAYIGFFLNAFNLIPLPPFDGGGISAAIDPRLWIIGVIGLVAWIVFFATWSPFTIMILIFVGIAAVPRLIALSRGQIDPRFAQTPVAARWSIAIAYFVTIGIALAGALVSHVDTASLSHT